MKRRALLGAFLLLVFFVAAANAVPIKLGDAPLGDGSDYGTNANLHNLSSRATHGGIRADDPSSDGTTEICKFCHTPHGATPQSPLWSRPDPDTMGTWPLFNRSSSLAIYSDATTQPLAQYGTVNGASEYPNGATKLCLSCHDGVTSIGTLVDGTPIRMFNNIDTIATSKQVTVDGSGGTVDFSRTHPVSFYYSSAVASAIDTFYGAGTQYQYPSDRTLLDGQERVQCTTCHDPHLDTEITDGVRGGGSYRLPFWRKYTGPSNEASDYDAVCNSCHVGTDYNPGGTHNL